MIYLSGFVKLEFQIVDVSRFNAAVVAAASAASAAALLRPRDLRYLESFRRTEEWEEDGGGLDLRKLLELSLFDDARSVGSLAVRGRGWPDGGRPQFESEVSQLTPESLV